MDVPMISREEWGAVPPKGQIPAFEVPGLHVVLTLRTQFDECTTKEDCMQKVKAMQKLHMEDWGLPDIAYNFIMGNDGNVYEGRGWLFRPAKAIGNAKFTSRTYDIGLIGDYRKEVPDPVYYLSLSLLKYGVQFEYVDSEHTYIGDWDEYKERKKEVRIRKKQMAHLKQDSQPNSI